MQNDKIKEYWEGEAGIYSEGIKAELKSETAENWKNLILEYAPEKEHLEVLDVGCGPGFFEIMLGKEGHHVTGIDITENMIHEAKENVKAAGLSADLMTMDCHNLNFPDETFDMIICRNITWTLDDPQKAYKEWLRVLKKGGRLLVSDACWYLHLYDEEKKKLYDWQMQPMLVLPTVRGPREAGSGRTALRNCRGTISLPSNMIGSIEVMPTFSRHLRCVR